MMDPVVARARLTEARLYGILDLGYVDAGRLEQMTEWLCEGGVDLLQIRAKGRSPREVETLASRIHPLTQAWGVPLIINDYPEVAASLAVEGVHVGQDDAGVEATRQIVGETCLVGKSTHSLEQARAAGGADATEPADYIGFGPLYATGTKPDYLPIGLAEIAEVHREVGVPIFCIGGVNQGRAAEIIAAGARRVVAVSALLQAPDVPAAVRALKGCLPVL